MLDFEEHHFGKSVMIFLFYKKLIIQFRPKPALQVMK